MKNAYLALLVSVIGLTTCQAQSKPWENTKNWRLYPEKDKAAFSFPADSLAFTRNALLSQDSVQFYLQKMEPMPPERTPTWMGAYLGSYENSAGKINKIEIGVYGGYFYDVSTNKYYWLPKEYIRPWQKFITRNIPD